MKGIESFQVERHFFVEEQSGAVEACWAHNPEDRRSKLRSASIDFKEDLSVVYVIIIV